MVRFYSCGKLEHIARNSGASNGNQTTKDWKKSTSKKRNWQLVRHYKFCILKFVLKQNRRTRKCENHYIIVESGALEAVIYNVKLFRTVIKVDGVETELANGKFSNI